MQMPRSCSLAIPVRNERSKRCSRSRSWIFGATSRAAQSRTIVSTARCSSLRSKQIRLTVLPGGLAFPHDGAEALFEVLGGHERVQVDVFGVAHRVQERQVEAAGDGAAGGLQDGRAALLELLDE